MKVRVKPGSRPFWSGRLLADGEEIEVTGALATWMEPVKMPRKSSKKSIPTLTESVNKEG